MQHVLLALLVSALGAGHLLGQTAQRIGDINKTTQSPFSSTPTGFVTLPQKSLTVFAAWTEDQGRELWVYDRLNDRARLLKDIEAGRKSSDPLELTKVGALVYFTATTAKLGRELWVTDGTSAGTRLVADIFKGITGSQINRLTAVGSRVAFLATDGTDSGAWSANQNGASFFDKTNTTFGGFSQRAGLANGRLVYSKFTNSNGLELWTSDLTKAGTKLLRDLWPGPTSGLLNAPLLLTQGGTRVIFAGRTPSVGAEIFETDGSSASLRTEIVPGTGGVTVTQFAETPDTKTVYFIAQSGNRLAEEIWSMGTSGAARKLAPLSDGSYAAAARKLVATTTGLYLSSIQRLPSRLLRRRVVAWNGSRLLVSDIDPAEIVWLNANKVMVAGTSATTSVGRELYLMSAGSTSFATTLLADLRPGSASSSPTGLARVAQFGKSGRVVFSVDDGKVGREFGTSDGTSKGTVLRFDIALGGRSTNHANPGPISEDIPGRGVFAADDGVSGREPWATDGISSAGLRRIADLNPGAAGSNPKLFRRFLDGTVFAAGAVGMSPRSGLYRYSGGRVQLVAGFAGDITEIACTTTQCFFVVAGSGLWVSDGTTSGTSQLARNSVRSPTSLYRVAQHIYFAAADTSFGSELWISDGSTQGTRRVADIFPGGRGSDPHAFCAVGWTLYFVANDGKTGRELWKTDATAQGTVLVKDIRQGGSLAESRPMHLTKIGREVYFSADDGKVGRELWASDGSTAGTRLVADIHKGSLSSAPEFLSDFGGQPLFSANHPTFGVELFTIVGGQAVVLTEHLNPGTRSTFPGVAFAINSKFAAFAGSVVARRGLWVTDGTAKGTLVLPRINPSFHGSRPDGFEVLSGQLVFAADDPNKGRELFKIDFQRPISEILGYGCGGPGRVPELVVGQPLVGQRLTIDGYGGKPASFGAVFLGAAGRSPLRVGCLEFYVRAEILLGAYRVDTQSRFQAQLTVPNDARLRGVSIVAQAVGLPTDGPLGLDVWNAVRMLFQ